LVVKRKNNCKLIYNDNNYYLEAFNIFKKYKNKSEAFHDYKNVNKIDKSVLDELGRVEVEFYKEDLELILKSLEVYKFFINQNLFISSENEKLVKISTDIDFLFQIINTIYCSNFGI
jgi:hypothetical protein